MKKLRNEQLHDFMPKAQFDSHKMKKDGISDACRKLGDVTNAYKEENSEGNPKSKSNIIQIGLK